MGGRRGGLSCDRDDGVEATAPPLPRGAQTLLRPHRRHRRDRETHRLGTPCLHQVGLSQTFLERSLMASEWRVAEKKATCRRRSRAVALAPLGSFSKILRQVATSSVSMNRSASSSVKKRHASTSMMPRFTRSQTFSGVPVTISTSPFLRACSASFVLMPPISNAHLMCGSCK